MSLRDESREAGGQRHGPGNLKMIAHVYVRADCNSVAGSGLVLCGQESDADVIPSPERPPGRRRLPLLKNCSALIPLPARRGEGKSQVRIRVSFSQARRTRRSVLVITAAFDD